MYFKIENGIIVDVKFKIFGCGVVVVISLMVIEMVKGKIIEEVLQIINKVVVEVLDGFLVNKFYCLVLVEEVIKVVIEDYFSK